MFFVGKRVTPPEYNVHAIMGMRNTGTLLCWYQSVALVEILLSAGITARIVKCLPKIYERDDMHMAVLVFDHEKSRWFFVDPTFNTFFYSDAKDALDIFEIRAAYQTGEIPAFRHITIDKQWVLVCSGITCETYDVWYTLYMAKNVFRFMSPAKTHYNCLSDAQALWISITPSKYHARNAYDKGKNTTRIHNMNAFLQKP